MDRFEGKLGLMTTFFIRHAVAIFVIATVVCLVLVSSLTNALKPNVIGVWLVVGILTSLLFSGVALVVVLAVAAVNKARHLRVITYEDKAASNLRDRFSQEKLKVQDFYSPFFLVNANKTFSQCELQGPGALLLDASSVLADCAFHLCDLIMVEDGDKANTAAIFTHSTFQGCRFVNVVVYMPRTAARAWLDAQPEAAKGGICVVGR